jgi:hypothetical protein
MVHCLSMSKPLMIGEWSAKSSSSSSLNITYWTFASESPISRLSFKECHKPKPLQKGDWNWPTSITSCLTSMSLAPLSPVEEGEITVPTRDNGGA